MLLSVLRYSNDFIPQFRGSKPEPHLYKVTIYMKSLKVLGPEGALFKYCRVNVFGSNKANRTTITEMTLNVVPIKYMILK